MVFCWSCDEIHLKWDKKKLPSLQFINRDRMRLLLTLTPKWSVNVSNYLRHYVPSPQCFRCPAKSTGVTFAISSSATAATLEPTSELTESTPSRKGSRKYNWNQSISPPSNLAIFITLSLDLSVVLSVCSKFFFKSSILVNPGFMWTFPSMNCKAWLANTYPLINILLIFASEQALVSHGSPNRTVYSSVLRNIAVFYCSVPTFDKLRFRFRLLTSYWFRFRFRLRIWTIKAFFTREKLISLIKFIVKYDWKNVKLRKSNTQFYTVSVRSFVIPFYYGSSSGSVLAKSYGSESQHSY